MDSTPDDPAPHGGGTDAYLVLAQTVTAVDTTIQQAGLRPDDVIDTVQLSLAAGVPQATVTALLSGARIVEVEAGERIRERFAFLRTTRLSPNGCPHTLRQIARGAGVSRRALKPMIDGPNKPLRQTVTSVERFFHVPRGYLTADAVPALIRALRDVLHELGAGPAGGSSGQDWLRAVQNWHGTRGTVCMPGGGTRSENAEAFIALASVLDDILSREKQRPPDPG